VKYICGLVLCFISSEVVAQSICGPRAELILRLWDKWQEAQIAHGLVNDNQLMEVFANKSGSWTILITDPSGVSCVAGTGKNWTVTKPITPKEKAL